MVPKHLSGFIVMLVLCLGLTAAPPGVRQANAGQEDAALFQEALSSYGQWFTYGSYGPVWRPKQINRDWRPYSNGRWVPTQDGYVFETDEPWGWATYHYGNWLFTRDHGWVWVPGRTWYPHTVNWRTNDENVGWAPVPPPEYLGAENYSDSYPAANYGSASGYNLYGSYPGTTLASSWAFIRATDFLLGWGQPYSSVYSYANTGVLLGPQYIPVVYERTVYVVNYVSPSYAANAYYNWGPPLTYITRVTKIKNIEADHRYKDLRLARLRNVMPPASLMQHHPAWREVFPMASTARQGHLRSVPNFSLATGKLNYPDAIPAPASLPPTRNAARPSANLMGNQQTTVTGKTQPWDNRKSGNYPSASGQVSQSASQSTIPGPSGTSLNSTANGLKKRPETLPKSASTTTSPSEPAGQHLLTSPAHRQYQSAGEHQRIAPTAENPLSNSQAARLQNQQRAEQELKMRQQEAKTHSIQEQQLRSQQQAQMEQQRRVEMMQQQQQRQAVMQQQQRQAELMRVQQMQQQQQIRQAPPPPQHTSAQPQQKKRDNQPQ